MTGYIGINQSGVQNITNLISNGSLASNTTSWTMASTYYTTTQYNGYIGSVVTTTSSTPRYHTQSFTSVSGSTAATKQVLYCQAMVSGKPSNVSTPTVRVRQYKNGSSTATYTNLSSSTSSSISCNFSSINMSSLPLHGYAYAKINNGSTQYTSGTVTISKGDTITIYLNVGDNGNAGVYLYRDKLGSSDMPDYYEYSESLTYTWNSNNAPYDFMTVNITFEFEDDGYLNCFIKLVQAWNKNSTYLETYDGTDYYSYDRVEFAMASTSTANDTIFIKNIFIVNLTAKFGAGNEPTKAWCDENLQFNTNNNTISYLSSELVPIAQQIKGLYVGIGNIAKQAKKAYVGINGIAKLWYLFTISYVWEKYTLMYSETTPVSAAFIYYSSAFRVGSTYSFDSTTGQFTVNQTTNIANSSTGASNAVNKYYITLTSTSGSQTGATVYKITDASYSSNQNRLTLRLQRIDSQIYGKNTYVEDVADDDILAYPINGPQDGFWYIRKFDYTLSYTGNYTETLAEMDGMYYRLLELTGSGTLTLGEAKQADIWICGGGGGGGNPVTGSGGGGGAGAYTASVNNINLQNLVVTIGAGGGQAANGSQTAISGDCSLTANGGGGGPYQTDLQGINPDGGSGGTGGGTGSYDGSTEVAGTGNGIAKTPFSSNYFTYPYCDGGGGGGKGSSTTSDRVYGGAGGTNGSNGSKGGVRGYSGGAGGGHYGGKGGDGAQSYVSIEGGYGTGYGSGGGGGGVYSSSYWGHGGNGYQGVCIIRIPIPGVTPSSAPEPESLSDLTGTQWLFNDTLSIESADYATYSINFTYNTYDTYSSATSLQLNGGYGNGAMLYNSTNVYYGSPGSSYWSDSNNRTISITGGTDATNATLIAWLQANATQVTS